MIPDPTYTVSIDQTLPELEKRNGKTVITYSLTTEECLYVTFQYPAIKTALDQKATHIFLGASPQIQQIFNAAIREYTTTPPELSTLVSSIAAKTASYVMNTLKVQGNKEALANEQQQQAAATKFPKQALKGAFITAREAQVMVTFVEQHQAHIAKDR